MKKIRVAIIDDHVVVRMGLKFALRLANDMVFAGELSGSEGAGEFAKSCKADVILLDIRMPRNDGISALRDIRAVNPEAKVVMLTTAGTDEEIYRALEAGASGYVLKDEGSDAIFTAIRAVMSGQKHIPLPIQEAYERRKNRPQLTPRESAALERMATGCSNREIAEALGVSEACVKVHLTHVFDKLGVRDRVGAVRVAIERGMVTLSLALCCLFAPCESQALTVPEIMSIPRQEAELRAPTVVTGVVTLAQVWNYGHPNNGLLADPSNVNGPAMFFTDSIPVDQIKGSLTNLNLQAGDLVELSGTVCEYLIDPGVLVTGIKKLGKIELPPPPRLNRWDLEKESNYNRRAQFVGHIQSHRERNGFGTTWTVFELKTADGIMPVTIHDLSYDWEAVMDRDVCVEGVILPKITSGGEVLFSELEVITPHGIRFLSLGESVALHFTEGLRIVVAVLVILLLVGYARFFFVRRRAKLRANAIAEDRRRIAGELHDTVAQYLSGTKIILTSIMGQSRELPSELRETLDAACSMLDRARQEVRNAIHELTCVELMTNTLSQLVRMLELRWRQTGKVEIVSNIKDITFPYSPELKRDAIAIANEAVMNAVNHGEAKTIFFNARPYGDNGFEICIANDGKKFEENMSVTSENGHFGLESMQQRAKRSGFELKIDGQAEHPFVSFRLKSDKDAL